MLNVPLLSKLTEDFKQHFKSDLTKSVGTSFSINRTRLRDTALYLHENGADFIQIIIADIGEKFELVYEYHFRFFRDNKFWFIFTEVDKKANEIDSIEIIYPNSKYIETEISKRYGLKFVSFATDAGKELFTYPTPINSRERESNIVPIGIYNKIHAYNNYFNLQILDEKIVAVVQKTGWIYRGILPLMKHKNAISENSKLTKKITALSSFHHNLAYSLAIETLCKIKVSERVQIIRTLLCEMERYESHLLWFINLFYLLGFKHRYYYLLKRWQNIRSIYQVHFKVEFLDDLNHIGFVSDLDRETLTKVRELFDKLFPLIFNSINNSVYKNYIRDKCDGVGVLSKEDALDAGVTGPNLRASGVKSDIRFEKPYLYYLENKELLKAWDVVVFKAGDVFARIETRLWELKNSCQIVKCLIEILNDDNSQILSFDSSKIKLPANENALIQLESPRGELLYYLKTSSTAGTQQLEGVYIGTPSLKNFLALNNYVLKNNRVEEFALIVHSLDLDFNEIDL